MFGYVYPCRSTCESCEKSAFLCFNGLENYDIFYIYHNNVHGNELVEFSIENLHLVCYTESLVVWLFLIPHKRERDLK